MTSDRGINRFRACHAAWLSDFPHPRTQTLFLSKCLLPLLPHVGVLLSNSGDTGQERSSRSQPKKCHQAGANSSPHLDGIFIKHRQGKSSDAETPFTRPRPIAETTFTPPRPIAQHPFFLQEIDRGDSFSNLRDRPRRLLFQHGSVISRN